MGGLVQAALEHGPVDALDHFRAAAPLPDDAQRFFDKAIVRVGRNRLAIADDVISRGLTYSLPNWLAVPELYWEQEADVGNVRVVMDPSSRMDSSMRASEGKTMPIPAIVSDFGFGLRTLLVSQRAGLPLDDSLFENHTRRVNEKIEDIFINGWTAANGNSIFGLLNAPNVNTVTYSGTNKAWDHASKTGAEILTDVLAMANALKADKFYGPYTLFIEKNYENAILKDYVSGYPKTIRARLEELSFGGTPLRIVTADQLPDDRTAMVQMTSNVIQAVIGQTPTQMSWSGEHPMGGQNFGVLACVLPRIRDTYDDTSGICTGNVS
jgi:hypothetical protein